VSHVLARPHGLSLIDLECNLKFQGKFQTGWFGFGRFSLHRRHASATKIGPTSTQVASGRGKAWTVANLGASGGEDEFRRKRNLR
jgi:hypothetical protein